MEGAVQKFMRYFAPCALRAFRKGWGLSQRELAAILGFEDAAQLSRIEHGKRVPRFEIALACSTLFGVSLHELFPQLATKIEEKLQQQIARLREGSFHTTTSSEMRKQELFTGALSRIHDEVHSAGV